MAEMSVFFHDALADHHSGREEHHMLFVGQLSEGDRRELRRLLRHANAPLAFRARLLVLSADGFSVPAISQMLGAVIGEQCAGGSTPFALLVGCSWVDRLLARRTLKGEPYFRHERQAAPLVG